MDKRPFHISFGDLSVEALKTKLLKRKEQQSRGLDEAGKLSFTMEAGDVLQARPGGMLSQRVPVAYEVWYLHEPGGVESILPENIEELSGFMARFPVAPVKVPRITEELSNGPKKIWTMRYEVRGRLDSFTWEIGAHNPNDVVGFLDFVNGPLGVMEQITLACEISGDDDGEIDKNCGQILPPEPSSHLNCPGRSLLEMGYLPKENVKIVGNNLSGEVDPGVHNWLRVFLDKDQNWPIPGEFLGMLCRPFTQYPWFNQDTAPFLYSGNWFETLFFTSGEIIESLEDNIYSVRVRGVTITIKSSDFLEYAVGDRVAVLKQTLIGREKPTFTWKDLENIREFGDVITNWVIIPMTFYEN